MCDIRQDYGRIGRKPHAYEVMGLLFVNRFSFVEKYVGFIDRKENQLCETEKGQTTYFDKDIQMGNMMQPGLLAPVTEPPSI